ncbi:coproporphyrinogen dehydrogenase HemZ [Butyrivibrio sp. NC2002]|uniref:coproporphyrinogen dehydrogenase HemZ n=1 Tax=Butyrivibrio sp. NC2002 TaxID=1410610 RepID=UPI00055F633D|nr:coproporphyrinogen dehydrogenase HemZ [Butyrivibrio sp. NC2002]
MILVEVSKDRFKYDIHSLVKAFYPAEDVLVLTKEEIEAKKENGSLEKEIFKIDMIFDDENKNVEMIILENGEKLQEGKAQFTEDNDLSDNSTNGTKASKSTPKNALKQLMYSQLSQKVGHELPWGALTGIRPTRIPMQMLYEGKNSDEIREYMKDTFFVSDEKIDLSLGIAKREKAILDSIDHEDGYSIYIGIPFCPTTCLYCSFTSFPIVTWAKRVGDYLTCLEKEIDFVAEAFGNKKVNSVYIGGGTPTTLEPDQIRRLIGYLGNKIDISNISEFTVESGRPDSITRDKLRAMKECGVSRISVNPQTMSDETLKRIGRQHSVAQFVDAYNMAREEGFDNINMDIILGLPGEELSDVEHTMREIEKLRPNDLTVHSLSVKRGSRLAEHIRNEGYFLESDTGRMMEIAAAGARSMGLMPYYMYRQKNISGNLENTGYAEEGKAGIYNILMMEEVQSIVALGAGTVSKRVYGDGRIERCDNVKDVTLYMNDISQMIERKRKMYL